MKSGNTGWGFSTEYHGCQFYQLLLRENPLPNLMDEKNTHVLSPCSCYSVFCWEVLVCRLRLHSAAESAQGWLTSSGMACLLHWCTVLQQASPGFYTQQLAECSEKEPKYTRLPGAWASICTMFLLLCVIGLSKPQVLPRFKK